MPSKAKAVLLILSARSSPARLGLVNRGSVCPLRKRIRATIGQGRGNLQREGEELPFSIGLSVEASAVRIHRDRSTPNQDRDISVQICPQERDAVRGQGRQGAGSRVTVGVL